MVRIAYIGNGHGIQFLSEDGSTLVESFEGNYGYDTRVFTLKEGDDRERRFVEDHCGANGSWTTIRGVEQALRACGIKGIRVRRGPGRSRRPCFDLGD